MMYVKIKRMGKNRSVLSSIRDVTSFGLHSYSEARLMFATARGTIISIKITPWTK
jgi:ribosomal protein S8